MRSTKIVATIGPASRDLDTLERMIRAGMDVARLNFAHESPEEHAVTVPVDSTLVETGARVSAGTRFTLEPRCVAVFEVSGSQA